MKNGDTFRVQQSYEYMRDRWNVRTRGIDEQMTCDYEGRPEERVTFDWSEVSQVHEILPRPAGAPPPVVAMRGNCPL